MRVADCTTVWVCKCLQLIYLSALPLTLFDIYIRLYTKTVSVKRVCLGAMTIYQGLEFLRMLWFAREHQKWWGLGPTFGLGPPTGRLCYKKSELLGWDPQPAASVTKSPNFWAGTPNRPPLLQKVRTFGLGPPTGRLCYKKSQLLGWEPQPAASVTKSPNFWAGAPPPPQMSITNFNMRCHLT